MKRTRVWPVVAYGQFIWFAIRTRLDLAIYLTKMATAKTKWNANALFVFVFFNSSRSLCFFTTSSTSTNRSIHLEYVRIDNTCNSNQRDSRWPTVVFRLRPSFSISSSSGRSAVLSYLTVRIALAVRSKVWALPKIKQDKVHLSAYLVAANRRQLLTAPFTKSTVCYYKHGFARYD